MLACTFPVNPAMDAERDARDREDGGRTRRLSARPERPADTPCTRPQLAPRSKRYSSQSKAEKSEGRRLWDGRNRNDTHTWRGLDGCRGLHRLNAS